MKYSKIIKIWLFIGLVMVFIQVIVGGITRLTESGLSITKWEVVTGILPPISGDRWNDEFMKYKQTPQYLEINEGMSLDDFKFIYFWEYIHRLWARMMGFVFLIPFIYFYSKGMLDKTLIRHLAVVVFFAFLAAIFGWIMVASGLIERPWVNAYKLSIHLLIAVCVFVALLWTYLKSLEIHSDIELVGTSILKTSSILFGIIGFQLFLGGMLSGMKAAVIYPTWPDMNGSYFPDIIFIKEEWNLSNFYNYDRNSFMPALIHFLHRNTAYLILILGVYLIFKLYKTCSESRLTYIKWLPYFLLGSILIQILLGIFTVINSKGSIPVALGVMHQGGALGLITVTVFAIFVLRIKKL
ncbi:MAG: COX15/CtaA family protein [Saprospiraceae bacterium]